MANRLTFFVDQQKIIYVSDTKNSRVMKWIEDATEGVRMLKCFSRGLYVDSSGTVFIADYGNHRLVYVGRKNSKKAQLFRVEISKPMIQIKFKSLSTTFFSPVNCILKLLVDLSK